jgi:hypothetical protein
MLSRMTSESMWLDRVTRWRASGQTSDEFASGEGFSAGGLRYWSSRLARAGKVKPETRRRPRRKEPVAAAKPAEVSKSKPVKLSRVVIDRAGSGSSPKSTVGFVQATRASVAIELGGVVVRVESGFDAVLLRQVVGALAGGLS